MTTYFILWYGKTKFGKRKFGNTIIKGKEKIENGETFVEVIETIKKENNLKDAIALRIKELSEEKITTEKENLENEDKTE